MALPKENETRPTVVRLVTFVHPFSLAGLPEQMPPGGYLVETESPEGDIGDDERRPGDSTFFRMPQLLGPSGRQHAPQIELDDLERVLARDRARIEDINATPADRRSRKE